MNIFKKPSCPFVPFVVKRESCFDTVDDIVKVCDVWHIKNHLIQPINRVSRPEKLRRHRLQIIQIDMFRHNRIGIALHQIGGNQWVANSDTTEIIVRVTTTKLSK